MMRSYFRKRSFPFLRYYLRPLRVVTRDGERRSRSLLPKSAMLFVAMFVAIAQLVPARHEVTIVLARVDIDHFRQYG